MVFMMKPSVGLTVFTSSFINRLTIVVLPALSSPLRNHQQSWLNADFQSTNSIKILISLSFNRALRKIESIELIMLLLQWTWSVDFGGPEVFQRWEAAYFACSPTDICEVDSAQRIYRTFSSLKTRN